VVCVSILQGRRTMMWADRLAIGVLGILLVLDVLIIGIDVFNEALFPITAANLGRVFGWFLGSALLVVFPLWLVLRIVDWVFGGPARRRAPR
jgi:hypothetical protein